MLSVDSTTSLVLSLLGLSLLTLCFKAIYNVWFHPLAGFPGPRLAAATKWTEFYYDLIKGQGGQFAWEMDRMHDRYGPIVRINPDEIHIKDPSFYEVLYTATGGKRDKYPPAAKMSGTPLSAFGTEPHDLHRQRRAPISQFFSRKTVYDGQDLIRNKVTRMCDNFDGLADGEKVVDLRIDLLGFTTDTFALFAFGEDFGYMRDRSKAIEWFQTIQAVGELTNIVKQVPWIIGFVQKYIPLDILSSIAPALSRVLVMHENCTARAAAFLDRITSSEPKASEKTGERPDMFDTIWTSTLPPHEKSLERLGQEAFSILAAGGETTARAMARGLYHIAADDAILRRLQIEVDAAMPDGSIVPALAELEALPYLRACVRETLRETGPVASRLPLIVPNDTLEYQGWRIPAGTPVSMTIHKTTHAASVFGDPEAFRPERWLADENAKNDVRTLDKAYVPFGRGSRMCPGQHFAYAEMYMALAALIRRFHFDVSNVDYERDIAIERDNFLAEPSRKSQGVRVLLTRRP